MDKTWWILFIIFVAGLVILLMPDNDAPVVSLNKRHGPSFPDLAGLILIMASWLASTIFIIKRWNQVIKKTGRNISYLLLSLYLLSLFGIILSLSLSAESILWIGATVALAINIFFIVSALRS